MWAYVFRRLIYNIPVYLTIIFVVMALLRVNDPVYAFLGKNTTQEDIDRRREEFGLDQPFLTQYGEFLKRLAFFDFSQESWSRRGRKVSDEIAGAVIPTLSLTIPALTLTSLISIFVGMISAFFRGRNLDRGLVFFAVLGMSISFLVYIILGQYFIAYLPQKYFESHDMKETWGSVWFAIQGYEPGLQHWFHYIMLPVLISVIVAMGYDTRFYRAVMVEETGRDYIVTARSKGATQSKIMFVHMLRNALIPIVTRIMITLPFLITGSILLEMYFNIPGMGKTLITAINEKNLPIIETFTSLFAGLFILSNILTDVLYAIVDPRVRLT